ncbi:MAG: pyruvate, water dikinase, partial [Opitutae bacterium]|nr:pyruvate, water dikinase [Opitutae bacterium]
MLKRLADLSRNLLSLGREPDLPALPSEEVEALQLTFKSRYHSFKLLLAANTRILEVMADIERALQGNEPFSMSFVQTASASPSVNVFRMIKDMENIAPGRYDALRVRFTA